MIEPPETPEEREGYRKRKRSLAFILPERRRAVVVACRQEKRDTAIIISTGREKRERERERERDSRQTHFACVLPQRLSKRHCSSVTKSLVIKITTNKVKQTTDQG
jgi:hypothetical protein